MRKLVLCFALLVITIAVNAQTPVLPGLPAEHRWRNNPVDWKVKDGVLTIKATEKTDWFISPLDGQISASSPIMLFPAAKEFSISAKVMVEFQAQWDAGVLAVYADEKNWVKFCFEKTVEQKPSIVTVITRGLSDDATHLPIVGNAVYMKIAQVGQATILYYSMDGKKWTVVRALALGTDKPLYVGFSAQSPVGKGSSAEFSEISYKPERVKDFWKGE